MRAKRSAAEAPKVSAFALSLAHDEILRLRERQVARTSSVRARGTAILGASGIAASLVTVLGDNPWYAVAIGFFALAAMSSVIGMAIRTTEVMHPKGVLASMVGVNDFDARFRIIKQIHTEYNRAEEGLRLIARHTRIATAWFTCGTLMLLMVSALPPIASISGRG